MGIARAGSSNAIVSAIEDRGAESRTRNVNGILKAQSGVADGEAIARHCGALPQGRGTPGRSAGIPRGH
jgi:hypothetical protein